jgi:PBP1b-binding outer membrane lipoprotein LpoB
MKKTLLILACALLLTACADKQQYEQVVLEQMQKEQDIKDYKLSPEDMTNCVVAQTAEKMPGVFPLDPARLTAYRNYSRMLSTAVPKDPKTEMEQLRADFGSPQALSEAHANYTESLVECYSVIISKTEGAAKAK